MAETRQTVIERIARFVFQLQGAEEVEKKIETLDRDMLQYAQHLRESKEAMTQLSQGFKEMGISMSKTTLQQLPQTINFLYEYGKAMEALPEGMHEVSAAEWLMTDAGREAAISTGLVSQSMLDAGQKAEGLRSAFWDLNTAARAILRVFVAFKAVMGMLDIFREMAEASARLQAELWRLRAIVTGLSSEIEGGTGTWSEWLDRVERLRSILPGISMVEVVEGLRGLTATLGPLGLTADEIERVTGLVGQMSIVFGQELPSYTSRFVSALGGALRNVKDFGVDLRDSNQAMLDYAESLGFIWDELNAGQRQWIRLGFFVQEATKLTGLLTQAEGEEWLQLEELRAKREDILTQSPQLIEAQKKWAEVLLLIARTLERIVDLLTQYGRKMAEALGWMIPPVKTLIGLWDEWQQSIEDSRVLEWIDSLKEPWQEGAVAAENFNETVKEGILALEDQEEEADDLADALSGAYKQAQSALRNYQRAVEQAAINLSRRLADITRNLGERLADIARNLGERLTDIARDLEERLADLERSFERRRTEIIEDFNERRAEIRQEAAEREQDLREDLNKRLARMEEDHLREMRELRDEYLIDLEEAARSRDAISMRRIQQRYILEKRQREEEHRVNRRRAIEDYEEQLKELQKARAEQEKELEESLERQLRELQENYEQQQKEARENAERQREDAERAAERQREDAQRAAQRQREDALRNYQEQLSDLQRNFQERLADIIFNLTQEEEEWEGTYDDLRKFFDQWYYDDLTKLTEWLNARIALINQAKQKTVEPGEPGPIRPPISPRNLSPYYFATGGMGLATSPTQIMIGEKGPEMFAAWPFGERMPRAGLDIRLTIDGTQQGMWSANFETEMMRILRGVLEEAYNA